MGHFSFLRYWALQFFTILFLLLSCHTTNKFKDPDKIDIREDVEQFERSAITLLDSDDEVNCSGVAISAHEILTAKHCQGFLLYSEVLQKFFGISYPSENAVGRMVSYKTFDNDNIKKGMIQKIDPFNDLALITTIEPLQDWVEISNETVRIGDEVVNIGNPAGIIGILSKGTVSGLHYFEGTKDATIVSTGLSIVPGSSGSSILHKNKVVGVVIGYNTRVPTISYSVNLITIRNFLEK